MTSIQQVFAAGDMVLVAIVVTVVLISIDTLISIFASCAAWVQRNMRGW